MNDRDGSSLKAVLIGILALAVGAMIGGTVNFAIVKYLPLLIPAPEGMDPSNLESIQKYIPQFKWYNFLPPFLGHALGTLVGAFIATKIAIRWELFFSLIIGLLFLYGGYMMVQMIPESPMWFDALDLIVAYIPMAWLGWKLAK